MAKRRNYTNVRDETVRRAMDPPFTALHDELETAYYQFWKNGESKPFLSFDVQPTMEESKALFDKLHGTIFLLYDIRLAQRLPNTRGREQDRASRARQRLYELEAEGIDVGKIRTRLGGGF